MDLLDTVHIIGLQEEKADMDVRNRVAFARGNNVPRNALLIKY